MTEPIFTFDLSVLPPSGEPHRAAAGIARFSKIIHQDSEISKRANKIIENNRGYKLIECLFGHSPFLGQSILRDIEFACELFERGPDATFTSLINALRLELSGEKKITSVMAALRRTKRRVALTTAVADLIELWDLGTVTSKLSEFAELSLSLATAHVLRSAAESGILVINNLVEPENSSGYIVLGMGKLGARELNYSSDIDLLVLYNPEKITCPPPLSISEILVRVTRQLVKIMDERTADGYVFRTDLRLRPDPGATPIAVSTFAAEIYYESVGQNWERAAFIKARPVAGDREEGLKFLKSLHPFIWRKHLDFAAIEDIHSIKRQITAHRTPGYAVVRRDKLDVYNVKLGRGGIREIEFFTQTQQLIWGGRIPELRESNTCEALSKLQEFSQITNKTKNEMIAAYRYLRRMEHRLQMVDDNQTHSLPRDETALTVIAAFVGYKTSDDMLDDLLTHLQCVEWNYGRLFESAPDLGGSGSLVFTGSDLDPDTIATLEEMGFVDGTSISFVIRGWHHGRYRAMQSVRARELLTELTPRLLAALARTTNPDAALAKFDEFLARLPTGVQIFSLFYANPALLDLVAEIMGSAPRLANRLSHRPILLDSVLSSEFFEPLGAGTNLAFNLKKMLEEATDFQDILDYTRRWVSGHEFQIGVQLLRDRCSYEEAGLAMTDLADAALDALKLQVEKEFAVRHGQISGGNLAIIAFGKLGGQELTAESDLDLVFVYDNDLGVDASDGPVPLPPVAYYTRLGQRLIGAITSLTPEGRLYEVDMRLRPSGRAGPIAAPFARFDRYISEEAWTWEHMVLTRARIISTSEILKVRLENSIHSALTQQLDPNRLVVSVSDMRHRIEKEHGAISSWDIKYRRGGLIDIEFIAQYLQLLYAPENAVVLSQRTGTALSLLAREGFINKSTTEELLKALKLWRQIQSMLRLTLPQKQDVEGAPSGLHRVLVRTARRRNFGDLKQVMNETANGVKKHFAKIIDTPAKVARAQMDRTIPKQ